jgi:hypothetical protein
MMLDLLLESLANRICFRKPMSLFTCFQALAGPEEETGPDGTCLWTIEHDDQSIFPRMLACDGNPAFR